MSQKNMDISNLEVFDLTDNFPSTECMIVKIPTCTYDKVARVVEKSVPKKPKRTPKRNKSKGTWTKEEDELLLKLVKKHGPKKWPFLAQSIDSRNGKQCRERYLNHLDPSINHGEWAKEEDETILELHEELGNQWSRMSKRMVGRPANMIKNRWNSTLSKIAAQNGKRRDEEFEDEDDVEYIPENEKKIVTTLKRKRKTRSVKSKYSRVGRLDNDQSPKKKSNTIGKKTIPSELKLNDTNSITELEKKKQPEERSFYFPLPENFTLPEDKLMRMPERTGDGNEIFIPEPPLKQPKIDEEIPFTLNLEEDDSMANPFPSPAKRSINKDVFNNLIKHNSLINKEKHSLFEDPSIDEKLGILNSGAIDIQNEDDLHEMGYTKTSSKLKLNMSDSALFASDFGINLGSPSHLSLELWSPKNKEDGEMPNFKNLLRVNVHPNYDLL